MGRIFKRDELKPRRSWRRRLLITFNAVLAVLIVGGIAGAGYVKWQFNNITQYDFGNLLGDAGSGDPMTVLLVGSDTRALEAGQTKSFGSTSKVGGQRSDTIMLLRVDPKTKHAAILSLPRDLWVTIAGTNGKARINSAFDTGPETLIKTIQQNFDITIDHYAQVDFDSFRQIVNAVGGVEVPFAAKARDYGLDESTGQYRNLSGFQVLQTGCVNLSGDQALAYVRSRHYQIYENGRWVSDPLSDLGRIQRQQDFIRRVMHKAIDKAGNNPLTFNELVTSTTKNLATDDDFSLATMTQLARRFKSLDPNTVEMMTLPNTATTINGASVLTPKQPEAQETIDRFLNGDQAQSSIAIPAGSVSMRVLNGSGVAGQASQTSAAMSNVGFVVLGVGDAPATQRTTIRYATGQEAKTDVIARYVDGPVNKVLDTSLKGVDAVLVTGSTFKGVNNTGTTTSTVAPTTPSTTSTTSPFAPSAAASC